MPLPYSHKGNPHWPLPPNYPRLNREARKAARLAVMRCQTTSTDFVRAWRFQRWYYLMDHPDEGFFPAWYEQEALPSPPFHSKIVYNFHAHRRNAMHAPRGGAKSKVVKEIVLLVFLTWFRPQILLILVSDEFAKAAGSELHAQLDENERIRADFGDLRPPHGSKQPWNMTNLAGTNKARLRLRSIDAKLRGLGANIVIPDDCEYDPDDPKNEERARELSRQTRFKMRRIILPMTNRFKGSRFCAVGTRHRYSLWLHEALTSTDPIYGRFHRELFEIDQPVGQGDPKIYVRCQETVDGTVMDGGLLWPALWPHSEIVAMQAEYTPAEFSAEFRGRPIPESQRALQIHSHYNTYTLQNLDELALTDPMRSRAEVRWCPGAPEILLGQPKQTEDAEPAARIVGWADLLERMVMRGILVDPGGERMGSDYTAIHVVGMDANSALWSLDLDLTHDPQLVWIARLWDLGLRWRAHWIGVEEVALQHTLLNTVYHLGRQWREQCDWAPQVLPVKYPAGYSKPDRIMHLALRFQNGLIRLPADRASRWPYNALWDQIGRFSLDMAAMDKVDALDTLAMADHLMPIRALRPARDLTQKTPLQRMLAGERIDRKTGRVLAHLVLPEDLERENVTFTQFAHMVGSYDDDRDDDGDDGDGVIYLGSATLRDRRHPVARPPLPDDLGQLEQVVG